MNSAREASGLLQSEVHQLQQELKNARNDLHALHASKTNKVNRFGQGMSQFVKNVDDAYNRGKFQYRPMGPIGSLISISDMKFAVAVEAATKKVIRNFIVGSYKDQVELEKIRNGMRMNMTISKCDFNARPYDVRQYKAQHPQYKTVLDYIRCDNVVVENTLIDLLGIESQLVIMDTSEATRVMQQGRPPKNANRAFNSLGDEIFTDRFYSNMHSGGPSYLSTNVEGKKLLFFYGGFTR